MSKNTCPHCGASLVPKADKCDFCGQPLTEGYNKSSGNFYQQHSKNHRTEKEGNFQSLPIIQNNVPPATQNSHYNNQPSTSSNIYNPPLSYSGINPAWPHRNKIIAALLAIFLGAFGAHKFYLGKIGMGILYLLFTWTGIPAILGVIEGFIYLISGDENFSRKHRVRLD